MQPMNRANQDSKVHDAIRHQIRHNAKRIAHYSGMSERSVHARAEGVRKYDLRELPMFCEISGDYSPLEAAAAVCNRAVIELPTPDAHALQTLDVASLFRETGEGGYTVETALADGHVSADDLERCEAELDDVVHTALAMKLHVRRLYETQRGQLEFASLAAAEAR